jgi:hypothetical protein
VNGVDNLGYKTDPLPGAPTDAKDGDSYTPKGGDMSYIYNDGKWVGLSVTLPAISVSSAPSKDQSVERYDYNGSYEQYQKDYPEFESIDHANADAYYFGSGYGEQHQVQIDKWDEEERKRIALEKLKMFLLGFIMLSDVVGPVGAGGSGLVRPRVGLRARATKSLTTYRDKSASLGTEKGLGEPGSTITDPLVLKGIAKERKGATGLFLDPSNGERAFKHVTSKKHIDMDYHNVGIHGGPGEFGIARESFGFWTSKVTHYSVSDDALFSFIKNHSGWDGKKPILLQSCFGGCSQKFNPGRYMDKGFFYGEHFASNAQRMADALGVSVKAPVHKINLVETGFFKWESFVGPGNPHSHIRLSYQTFKPGTGL